ncbi:hypothetical protein V4F39_23305 [Aquincola sp. MAHUQ-54]|uniref:Uncharacterized protein n=2 Tax=Aquincola agrisoli TaxID=3119538 RepID=A0AAW9QCQ4_9BURK
MNVQPPLHLTRPWLTGGERERMSAGIGNWEGFNASPFTYHDILSVAREWESQLAGVERPWLCWNVDAEWSLLQQRMVLEVGWTPVVGFDPRVGPPPLLPGAVLIDFNRHFGFGTMYPHFPLDFAFAWCERLAFWHADLLMPIEQMQAYARRFETLEDGAMITVEPRPSMRQRLQQPHTLRYWELLGCVTRGASRSNFDLGCGWWLCFYLHPNCPGDEERKRRTTMYWDCGVGIRYWHKALGGKLMAIPEAEVDEGHYTRMRRKNYIAASVDDWRRDLSKELSANFKLSDICSGFGLKPLYEEALKYRSTP